MFAERFGTSKRSGALYLDVIQAPRVKGYFSPEVKFTSVRAHDIVGIV